MDASVYYYAAVFIVGTLAGISRCVRDGHYQSISNVVAVGSVAGFLAFGIVGILCGDVSSPDFNSSYYLGVAAIVGLAGKEQTALISLVWGKLFGAMDGDNHGQ